MPEQAAYAMFMDFLREQGYEPEGSDWGSEKALIVFLHNNLPFCIVITKNDEHLFELTRPFGAIDPGNPEEVANALKICAAISRETKVVKAYLIEGLLIGAVEMFCSPISQVKVVFARCLQTLAGATAKYEKKIQMRQAGTARDFRAGQASSTSTPILDDLIRRGLVISSQASGQGMGHWKQAIALSTKLDAENRQ